jgi:hypothetical protein
VGGGDEVRPVLLGEAAGFGRVRPSPDLGVPGVGGELSGHLQRVHATSSVGLGQEPDQGAAFRCGREGRCGPYPRPAVLGGSDCKDCADTMSLCGSLGVAALKGAESPCRHRRCNFCSPVAFGLKVFRARSGIGGARGLAASKGVFRRTGGGSGSETPQFSRLACSKLGGVTELPRGVSRIAHRRGRLPQRPATPACRRLTPQSILKNPLPGANTFYAP